MNDELEKLRPEVREALADVQGEADCRCSEPYKSRGMKDPQCNHDLQDSVDVIRAELRRLANENADYGKHAIEQYKRGVYWMDRAKEAESELAALKARIEGGIGMGCPVECFVGSRRGRIIDPFTPPGWIGKRVRLVVEE